MNWRRFDVEVPVVDVYATLLIVNLTVFTSALMLLTPVFA